jgi:hypothetical protein
MWQELPINKYLRTKALSHVQVKPTYCLFWKDIICGREEFFKHSSFVIGNGMDTCYWEEPWLGQTPLAT